jgi:hypothetical protein
MAESQKPESRGRTPEVGRQKAEARGKNRFYFPFVIFHLSFVISTTFHLQTPGLGLTNDKLRARVAACQ